MRTLCRAGGIAVAAAVLCAPALWAQPAPLSRTMRQAIQLYEKGKDQEALDRFVDILSRGDPEEKTLASDYITKINLRLARAQGGATAAALPAPATLPPAAAGPTPVAKPAPPPAAAPAAPPAAPLAATAATALRAPPPPAPPRPAPPAPAPVRSEAAMRKEIAAQMQTRRKQLIQRLRQQPGVQVSEAAEGKVDSIAVPSDLLFEKDVSFRIPQAEATLAALAGLAFLHGDAALLIWPEKFQAGEPSLVDMRRAMALRNFLLAEGVSPARVAANLIGSVGNPPKKLYGFSGPILQFRPGEPLQLSLQSTGLPAGQRGPTLSLGAQPERISPSDEQGTLIEFSALEGEDGVAGWRFAILPSANPEKGAPVQELTGEGPVFHQVYWNGRLNYFGEQMPYGRYPVLLTAQDLRGGKSTQRLLLVLEPPQARLAASGAAAPSAAGASATTGVLQAVAAAPALGGRSKAAKAGLQAARGAKTLASGPKSKKALRAAKAKKAAKGKKRRRRPPVAAPAQAATAPSDGTALKSGSINQIGFERDSTKLTPNGENDLAKAVDAIRYYPNANKVITGYAARAEANAAALAEKRAQVVKSMLADTYGVDPSTMRVQSKVVAEDAPLVEIAFEERAN